MTGILLTQNNTFIIGPVSKLLGYIMEGIFWVLDLFNVPNIGLAIILFTIVVNLLLMPFTIKQQKFSKLSAKMNPELQAIRDKYKNKKDNESMLAMNQETQAVYAKYGVSPSGSCLQLLIQMPILFALYRVIYSMPAYVGKIKDAFFPLVEKLIVADKDASFIQSFTAAASHSGKFKNDAFVAGAQASEFVQNTYIDVMNMFSSADWVTVSDKFPELATEVSNTVETLDRYNNFLGLNMANSPAFAVGQALEKGSWLLVIGALLIPLLSGLTQWISLKLAPQAASNDSKSNGQDTMVQSMKMMNTTMPIISIVFAYTMPSGMGLYWIAGAVVRTIQQIVINKHIDKMDLEEMIKKNIEKRNKKLEKAGIDPQKINNYATMSTRNVNATPKASAKPSMSQEEREEAMKKATEYYNKNAKPGSLAAKANMVKQYNENNK